MWRAGRSKEELNPILKRANAAMPDPGGRLVSVKALLVVAKNFVVMGDTDAACAMYVNAYEKPPDLANRTEWHQSPHLLNNVAMCDIRAAYHMGPEEAQPFHERALHCLESAVHEARARAKGAVIHSAETNLHEYHKYRANGGAYEGHLMW